jgi:hypothetical protein
LCSLSFPFSLTLTHLLTLAHSFLSLLLFYTPFLLSIIKTNIIHFSFIFSNSSFLSLTPLFFFDTLCATPFPPRI